MPVSRKRQLKSKSRSTRSYGPIPVAAQQQQAINAILGNGDAEPNEQDLMLSVPVAVKIGVKSLLEGDMDGLMNSIMGPMATDDDALLGSMMTAHLMAYLVGARDDASLPDSLPVAVFTSATGLLAQLGELARSPQDEPISLDMKPSQAALSDARGLIGPSDVDLTFSELLGRHSVVDVTLALYALVGGLVIATGGDIGILDRYEIKA